MQSTKTSFDARLKASRSSCRATAARSSEGEGFSRAVAPRRRRHALGRVPLPTTAGGAAGARDQHVRRVSCDTAGSARGHTGGAVFRQRRPSGERVRVRRLPRRESGGRRQGAGPRSGAAVQGTPRRAGDRRDVRPLPQRCRRSCGGSRRASASIRRPSTRPACTASSWRRATTTSRPARAATARTASAA